MCTGISHALWTLPYAQTWSGAEQKQLDDVHSRSTFHSSNAPVMQMWHTTATNKYSLCPTQWHICLKTIHATHINIYIYHFSFHCICTLYIVDSLTTMYNRVIWLLSGNIENRNMIHRVSRIWRNMNTSLSSILSYSLVVKLPR